MRRTPIDKMRFSRGIKFFAITTLLFCALSLWSSLKEPNAQTDSLMLNGYGANRKSLSLSSNVLDVDGNINKDSIANLPTNTINNELRKKIALSTGSTKITGVTGNQQRVDGVVNKIEGQGQGDTVNMGVASSPQAPPTHQRRTILMSYMRSGSTFTGDLFQASPDVLYMYEPLLYTNDADQLAPNTPIRSRLIGKFHRDSNPPETLDYTLDTLRCNLTGSNLRYMVGYSYSRSFDEYGICLKALPKDSDHSPCGDKVMKRCQSSRNVMSKILRLHMWEIDQLLARDPELQIIHLVRDPRGIAMSRSVAHYYFNVRSLCARMNTDATTSIDLVKKYPGRILTVRYEDLAMSPMNMTRKLFYHAGVKWTPLIAEKVQDLTSPRDAAFDEKIFGTKRKNSAATAFNWRSKLPFTTALDIQNNCKGMMELYGYNAFSNHSHMSNLDFPSIQNTYTDKYYKGQNIPLPEL